MISRREALQRLTLLLGGALSAELTAGVLGQVLNTGTSVAVSPAQTSLLADVADTIIPETDTPGAKAAGAERFIIRVVRDCYVREEQTKFYAGLATIQTTSQTLFKKPFNELQKEQRKEVLQQVAKADKMFFRWLRELTVTGYFTSEIGASQALVYLPIPGRFEGDVPMTPGQKAWAL